MLHLAADRAAAFDSTARRAGAGMCLLLAAASLLAGCRAPAALPTVEAIPTFVPPASTVSATSTPGTPDPDPATAAFPTDSGPDPVTGAMRALSIALGVGTETMSVVEVVPVQWNNSSLGCPEPDGNYLDVVTPGYLVTLAVGEATYSVHTDLGATAVVCLSEEDPIGPGTVLDPIAAEFIAQAREDLAQRTAQPVEALVLVRSDAVEWADSRLGCAGEDGDIVAGVTPGYRIVLAAGDVHYEYHTDQQRLTFCAEPIE